MADQELAVSDAERSQQAEEGIADFLFGTEDEREEPGQAPVEEGEESEEVEAAEETDEEPESEEETELEFVEIEYDGKLYEVPTELKDALLRQDDYTKKTQEVATQRKEVEAINQTLQQKFEEFKFAESIQEDVLKAQQLEQTANQYHEYLRNNIDTLNATDIEKLRMAIEDARRERDQIGQQLQGKQQEFQQAQEQSRTELLNQGTEILKAKIPNWGADHQAQVRDFALNLGFTEAEVNTVVDPRQVEVLWKAAQYEKLQQGKTSAVKKVQSAPAIKPRARDPKSGKFVKKQKMQKALKSTMPSDKKAALIGDSIADKFFS